ncbi:hypothetical protein [Afipia carboxidovorans]|uniref:hypothetical protein n=1 Tax=Afipia carboxidovorans TaxID=40137 RepID=UPI00017F4F94|nr:hypothetical protein [Afipia carboxidovorans]
MAPSDTATEDPRLGIGGNNPPAEFSLEDLVTALPATLAEAFAKRIADEVEPIANRANEAPERFASDEDLAAATEIVNDAQAAWNEFEKLRKNQKDPFKRGGEEVDDFFRPPLQRLTRIKDAFAKRATDYNREKRRKAEEAARVERERLEREAEEARKKAAEAAEFGDQDEAIEHLQTAATVETKIEEVASAPAIPAEDMTVRGASGGTARSRTEWAFEIEDFSKIDLNALRDFIAPEAVDKALKAYVKLRKNTAKIEGVRFFEDEKATFRRR